MQVVTAADTVVTATDERGLRRRWKIYTGPFSPE